MCCTGCRKKRTDGDTVPLFCNYDKQYLWKSKPNTANSKTFKRRLKCSLQTLTFKSKPLKHDGNIILSVLKQNGALYLKTSRPIP